jgi:hypothetical protein
MTRNAHCCCGALHIEVSADPDAVVACHCGVSAANRLGFRCGCLLQEGACSRRRALQNLCPRWAGGTKAQTTLLPDMWNDSVLGG